MLTEVGICKGIENYSAVLSGRAPGSMPTTLLDYFPEDFLLFVDESHVTLPQVRAKMCIRDSCCTCSGWPSRSIRSPAGAKRTRAFRGHGLALRARKSASKSCVSSRRPKRRNEKKSK